MSCPSESFRRPNQRGKRLPVSAHLTSRTNSGNQVLRYPVTAVTCCLSGKRLVTTGNHSGNIPKWLYGKSKSRSLLGYPGSEPVDLTTQSDTFFSIYRILTSRPNHRAGALRFKASWRLTKRDRSANDDLYRTIPNHPQAEWTLSKQRSHLHLSDIVEENGGFFSNYRILVKMTLHFESTARHDGGMS